MNVRADEIKALINSAFFFWSLTSAEESWKCELKESNE
jgi:hypothetical protein